MKLKYWIGLVALMVVTLACNFGITETRTPEPPPATVPPATDHPATDPPATDPPATVPPADTPAPPANTSVPAVPRPPEEAILILEPGPGSTVTSPVHIAGLANPTFEQTLGVRILLADGSQLAAQPVTIGADIGQRGPFALDIAFSVVADRNAFIQVYDTSARDGGLIHLAQVSVILSASGPANVNPGTIHPEDIFIQQPALGDTVSGGVAFVSGFGLASFEQTLVVEVYDANGAMVGQEPLIVNAPDLGQPGTFSANVSYVVVGNGPGRIVVRDPSAVFLGDNHLASVEITLEP